MRALTAERPWAAATGVAAVLGVLALLSNITSLAQLGGEADLLLGVRTTLSLLLNAGTVWAGPTRGR